MPDFNNDNPQNQWNNNFPNNPQKPYMQNPNNQYNNPYNNYQGNINPQNPYNMGYIPPQPTKSGSPKLIYIVLIAVIIFLAVIIVFMSTSIRVMFNGGNNQSNGSDRNNIIATENQRETTEEETTTEQTTTTTTTTVPVPETVTVTVVVEVEKEVVKEVIKEVPANNYEIYSGSYSGCVVTKSDPLNIRSTPDKNGKVLGSIPKGKYIDVYMTSETGWYYTTYGGVSGYVSADYIELILSGGYYDYGIADGDGHNGDWATIATKSDPLNLRSSPSTSASIITSIPKGSSVYVNYEYDSTWCYVTWGSYSGYVVTQYLAF